MSVVGGWLRVERSTCLLNVKARVTLRNKSLGLKIIIIGEDLDRRSIKLIIKYIYFNMHN